MNALPLLIHEIGHAPTQLYLQSSVGWGGRNVYSDIVLIQSLLNAVPLDDGGLSAKLKVDGKVGPKTIAAIKLYQQTRKLRVVDGRIDPCGATISSLGSVLVRRHQLPRGLPSVYPASRGIQQMVGCIPRSPLVVPPSYQGVQGRSSVASAHSAEHDENTGWKITSNAGMDVSIGPFGAVSLTLYLIHDTEPGKSFVISFGGIGASVGLSPAISADVSRSDWTSYGSQIKYGMLFRFALTRSFNVDAYNGLPGGLVSIGLATPMAGFSGSILGFGSVGAAVSMYQAAIAGVQIGAPNVGLSVFFGVWRANT